MIISNILEVQQATLYRDDVLIFMDINFELRAGQHALIKGQNGSGKTSLLRAICGFSELTKGDIKWNKMPIDDIDSVFQEDIAYLGHKNGLINEISVSDNLKMNPNIADLSQLSDLVEGLNLIESIDKPVEFLSSGQAKKVALVSLILSNRMLWIMDEPYANLDDISKEYLTLRILDHCKNNGMVITTSNQGNMVNQSKLEIIMEQ